VTSNVPLKLSAESNCTIADVKAAGVNPLDHYHTNGWKEGRDPSPNFDTSD